MPDESDRQAQQVTVPRRFRWQRLVPWLALVAGLAVVAWVWVDDPEPVGAVVLTVVVALAVAATFWSARRGPHVRYDRAEQRIGDGHAVVLWKPGCAYCERLLLQLRGTPGITWVNVYEDPQADAKVRSVNDGNQLTPTALVGGRVLRNPSAEQLRAVLDRGQGSSNPARSNHSP